MNRENTFRENRASHGCVTKCQVACNADYGNVMNYSCLFSGQPEVIKNAKVYGATTTLWTKNTTVQKDNWNIG